MQKENLQRVNMTDPECVLMHGRQIVRHFNEDLCDLRRRQFEAPASTEIYKRRKQKSAV